MAVTRIKVPVSVLLDKLRTEKARAESQFEKDDAKYESAMLDFSVKLTDKIEQFLDSVTADPLGALDSVSAYDRYSKGSGVLLKLNGLRFPEKPKLDTQKLDRLIAPLELAVDETLSISADDDYARYLR